MNTETTTLPHIVKNRHEGSFANWCVHYNGIGKSDVCDAGVKYADVRRDVEHTYSHGGDGHKYTKGAAWPCFRDEAHLTSGCAKCRYPTPEEIRAHTEEVRAHFTASLTAREAIVEHLGDKKGGSGVIDCPICKIGKLRYSRASCNGHIHAACSTPTCVRWME